MYPHDIDRCQLRQGSLFLGNPSNVEGVYSVYSPLIASIDMSALPFFVLVLIELCFARFLNIFKAAVIVAPFALCITLYQTTLSSRAYFLLFAMSIVYSILAIILVLWRLPVYRRLIQQEYSTVNKVHFHWTYYILVCFVFMLITWIVRTITQNFYADCLYIFASVLGWVLVSMFLVRIESLVRSMIQCGFDDTEDFHMFLQEKAKRTFSPSLSDLPATPATTQLLRTKSPQTIKKALIVLFLLTLPMQTALLKLPILTVTKQTVLSPYA